MNVNAYLGIELGSTRIKASLIGDDLSPIAFGSAAVENKFENGYWTYPMEDILDGIRECCVSLARDICKEVSIRSLGISGMMHGYLAFDADGRLLTPFRTWRNATTADAAKELTELFGFNVPQRWSIAHLYSAILRGEEHVSRIAHITTLAGYIHYLLTKKWEVGLCEASGIFPVKENEYDPDMLASFDAILEKRALPFRLTDILPVIRKAGYSDTRLSEKGAELLAPLNIKAGITVCPPEGDAATGMIATNSIGPGTGNISAGTSVFSMLVLESPLKKVYPEIDVVSTPSGHPVAMIHSNNGTSELDAMAGLLLEFLSFAGADTDISTVYDKIFSSALSADEFDKLICLNLLADEPISGVYGGMPMIIRSKDSHPSLADLVYSQIASTAIPIRLGNELLSAEGCTIGSYTVHGGLFKIRGVAQQIYADLLSTPISVFESSGEGGAYGMALLAAFADMPDGDLDLWLSEKVFSCIEKSTLYPREDKKAQNERYTELYKKALLAERALGGAK